MGSTVFAHFVFYLGLIPVNIKEELTKNRYIGQNNLLHKT